MTQSITVPDPSPLELLAKTLQRESNQVEVGAKIFTYRYFSDLKEDLKSFVENLGLKFEDGDDKWLTRCVFTAKSKGSTKGTKSYAVRPSYINKIFERARNNRVFGNADPVSNIFCRRECRTENKVTVKTFAFYSYEFPPQSQCLLDQTKSYQTAGKIVYYTQFPDRENWGPKPDNAAPSSGSGVDATVLAGTAASQVSTASSSSSVAPVHRPNGPTQQLESQNRQRVVMDDDDREIDRVMRQYEPLLDPSVANYPNKEKSTYTDPIAEIERVWKEYNGKGCMKAGILIRYRRLMDHLEEMSTKCEVQLSELGNISRLLGPDEGEEGDDEVAGYASLIEWQTRVIQISRDSSCSEVTNLATHLTELVDNRSRERASQLTRQGTLDEAALRDALKTALTETAKEIPPEFPSSGN